MKDEYISVKTYKKGSLELDKEPKNITNNFGQMYYLGVKLTGAEVDRPFFELDVSKCTVRSFTNKEKTEYKLYVEVIGKEQVEALENIFKDSIDLVINNQMKLPGIRNKNPKVSNADYLKSQFKPFLKNKITDAVNNIYRCSLCLTLNSNSEVSMPQLIDDTTSILQIDYTILNDMSFNAAVIFNLENIFINSAMAVCLGKVKTCLILNDIKKNGPQPIDISQSSMMKYLYEIQNDPNSVEEMKKAYYSIINKKLKQDEPPEILNNPILQTPLPNSSNLQDYLAGNLPTPAL